MTNVLTKNIAGREMKVESGRVGMLSDAAIFMSYGDTVILTNVNASEKPREGIDFFPLSVEYEERLYSVGKIPGGFIKREGRPSENAILFGRAVDRPLRPLFPKGYRNDVQVVCTVVSVEQDNLPEILAINAAVYGIMHIKHSIYNTSWSRPSRINRWKLCFKSNIKRKRRKYSSINCLCNKRKSNDDWSWWRWNTRRNNDQSNWYGFEKCQDIVAFQEEAMAKFGKEKKEPVLYNQTQN